MSPLFQFNEYPGVWFITLIYANFSQGPMFVCNRPTQESAEAMTKLLNQTLASKSDLVLLLQALNVNKKDIQYILGERERFCFDAAEKVDDLIEDIGQAVYKYTGSVPEDETIIALATTAESFPNTAIALRELGALYNHGKIQN